MWETSTGCSLHAPRQGGERTCDPPVHRQNQTFLITHVCLVHLVVGLWTSNSYLNYMFQAKWWWRKPGISTVWLRMDIQCDQWNGIESPDIKCDHDQLIFHKVPRPLNGEKESSFQQMGMEQLDSHIQKNEVGPLPHIIHKDSLKIDWRPKSKS